MVRGQRHDVWSDVNRVSGILGLVARDVSSSVAYDLKHALEDQGWRVELRPRTYGLLAAWEAKKPRQKR